jgi:hypothetical protein
MNAAETGAVALIRLAAAPLGTLSRKRERVDASAASNRVRGFSASFSRRAREK